MQPNIHVLIEEWFTYHRPTEKGIEDIKAVREAAKAFAEVIVKHSPDSADRAMALRKVREAAMTANAAIVLGGEGEPYLD